MTLIPCRQCDGEGEHDDPSAPRQRLTCCLCDGRGGRDDGWIRCSDRMPMGEAVEARRYDCGSIESWRTFNSATVETLRNAYGDFVNWIDRTEWRAVEEPRSWEEEHGQWIHETNVAPERLRELMANAPDRSLFIVDEMSSFPAEVFKPVSSTDAEAVKAGLVRALTKKEAEERSATDLSWWHDMYHRLATEAMKAWQERRESEELREGAELHDLFDRAEAEEETLRAVLERDGIGGRLTKFVEEAGEAIGVIGKHLGPDDTVGLQHRIADELADVSIVIDSFRCDATWREMIEEARARKLARLEERLAKR